MPPFSPPQFPNAEGPTYKGKSIFAWQVPAAGFEYSGTLEMYMVALEWKIPLDVWDAMGPELQARHIAVSRAAAQMRGITDHYINAPKRKR